MINEIKNQLDKFYIIQKRYVYFVVFFFLIAGLLSVTYTAAFQVAKYNNVLGTEKQTLKEVQANYESIRTSAVRSETIANNEQIATENLSKLEKVNAEVVKNYSAKIVTYSEDRKFHYDIEPLEKYLRAINDFYQALKLSGDRGPDKLVDSVDGSYQQVKRYI
jgi:hypothetical protein